MSFRGRLDLDSGWPAVRDLVSAFIGVLAELSPGWTTAQFVPVAVRGGSVVPTIRAPLQTYARLQQAENREPDEWTDAYRDKRAALTRACEKHRVEGMSLKFGRRELRIDAAPKNVVLQHLVLVGTIMDAGGEKGAILLDTVLYGRVRLEVGRPEAKKAGRALYERARAACWARTTRGRTVIAAEYIEDTFEVLGPARPAADVFAELSRELGDKVLPWHPEAEG